MKLWEAAEDWMTKANVDHADVTSFLNARFPSEDAISALINNFQALELEAAAVLGKQLWPGKPLWDIANHDQGCRLWQCMPGLSFVEPAQLPEVLTRMRAMFIDQTAPVMAHKSLVVTCSCLCLLAIELQWLKRDHEIASHPAIQQQVAKRILSYLQLHMMHKKSSGMSIARRPQPYAKQLRSASALAAQTSESTSISSIIAEYIEAQPSQVYQVHIDDQRARDLAKSWADIFKASSLVMPADIGNQGVNQEMWHLSDPWIQEDVEFVEPATQVKQVS